MAVNAGFNYTQGLNHPHKGRVALFDISIRDLSILLVEPSAMQRKLIVNQLGQHQVGDIESMGAGTDALTRIQRIKPDLVISSMYLPDMTGLDLITTMRNDPEQQDIPFMLISSENRFEILDPIRQAGVVAILPKPFAAKDLKRALVATLDFVVPEELQLDHYDPSTLKVLVVDDSRMARRHIQRVLSDMGIIHMTTAENGKEAVSLFEKHVFDLVVTDLNMPEMDGKQLIEYIRKQSSRPDTPIMMVTSEANYATLANVEQAGVSAICDKPFEPKNVRELLIRVLNA